MQSKEVNEIWHKGDKCFAPWSGDGLKYKATIKKLRKYSNNSTVAVIKYDGYSEEEDDEVDVKDLSKQPDHMGISLKNKSCESLFKPLKGNEDEIRIEEKYGSLDLSISPDVKGHPEKNQNRKRLSEMSVMIEGETWRSCKRASDVNNKNQDVQRQLTTPNSKSSPISIIRFDKTNTKKCQVQNSKQRAALSEKYCPEEQAGPSNQIGNVTPFSLNSTSLLVQAGTSGFDGFDEIYLEKPNFSFNARSEKVPYVLSKPGSIPLYQVPASINQHLRDYQREGIHFLFQHFQKNEGAILADDMGLGKTVQVIGLLSALLRKTGTKQDIWRLKPVFIQEMSSFTDGMDPSWERKPFLIIGPGCVLYNWLDELDTWGHFSVGKFHGSDKQQCLKDLNRQKLEVVITTFETFRDNKEYLNQTDWAAVIVDEVHRIKGLKAQTTQALRSIKCKCRYGLTGTVLQNNMMEMWSILDWARPGFLGSSTDFHEEFVKPIELGQKHNATKRQLANSRKCKQKFSEIRNKILIRRTKNLISLQLPQKDDNVVFCKLTDFQISIYKTLLEDPDLQDVIHAGDPCFCGSEKNQGKCCRKKSSTGKPLKTVMFQYLHLLLKVANHVALLVPDQKASAAQNQVSMTVCQKVFKNHPHFLELSPRAAFSALSDPKFCCKMKVLVELLKIFHGNHSKVLLFSYSTRLLDVLENYLVKTLYQYRRIDGKTSSKHRLDIVREFNKNPNIFVCLISTKAGGLGLNMTGANVVIIFDPNWNPSHDLQAQDRAYRIGQQRHVQVLRLISAGSIEENIYLRQVYKQQLDKIAVNTENAKRYFVGIQGNSKQKGELFGLKNMFQLRTGCLSEDILQRNEIIEKQLAGHRVSKYVHSSWEEGTDDDDDGDGNDDDSQNSNDKESSDDEDAYSDWFESIKDEVQATLGLSDEENLQQKEFQKKKQQKKSFTKLSKKKDSSKSQENSRIPSREKTNLEIHQPTTNQTPFQSPVPSFTNVFQQCGVIHIHENRKVTGGSRAEDYMTNCALQEVLQDNKNSQLLAFDCEPYKMSESDEEERHPPKKRKSKRVIDHNSPKKVSLNNYQVLYGQTPQAMLRKHLVKMSSALGFPSVQQLCQKIVKISSQERLNMLQEFYVKTHGPWLKPVFQSLPEPIPRQPKSSNSANERSKNSKKRKMVPKIRGRISKTDFDSELEIGKSHKKPFRQKTPQTRSSRKNPNQIMSSSPQKTSKIIFSTPEFSTPKSYQVNDPSKSPDCTNSTNIELLLEEIGETVTSHKVLPKNNQKKSNLSHPEKKCQAFLEVDHIFLDSDAKKAEVRKPAPKKRLKPTTVNNDRSVSSKSSNQHEANPTDKICWTLNSVDVLEDLLKNSTLKESIVSDPILKTSTRRPKHQKFSDHVREVLKEDEQEYKSLFTSGKMVPVCHENENSQTPSLF